MPTGPPPLLVGGRGRCRRHCPGRGLAGLRPPFDGRALEIDPDLLGEDGRIAADARRRLSPSCDPSSLPFGPWRATEPAARIGIASVCTCEPSLPSWRSRSVSAASSRRPNSAGVSTTSGMRSPSAASAAAAVGAVTSSAFRCGAHERVQLMRLVLVRFDGKDQRHGYFVVRVHDHHEDERRPRQRSSAVHR